MNDSPVPDNALIVQWIFGAAVVLTYAWDRFKSPLPAPLPPRSTTTFWRYWSAATGYLTAMLTLFVLVGGTIMLVDLKDLEPFFAFPKEIATLPGPLLSALLLTSLLPHFPMLAKVDESIRQSFWRVANIPGEVLALSARLVRAEYKPSEVAQQYFPNALGFGGADPVWLSGPEGSLKKRWANCVALFGQVLSWKDGSRYSTYVVDSKAAIGSAQVRLASLAQLLNEQTFAEFESASDSAILGHVRRNVENEMSTLWRALCDIVAGGVLSETRSERQRHAALTQLGFTGLPLERSSLSSNDIVLVAGLVFIAVLFIPLMVRRFFDSELLPTDIRVLIMVPIVYVISIVLAIYPKGSWFLADRTDGSSRPFAAYALSGIAAAFAAFLVSMLFRFAFDSHGNVLQSLSTPGAFAKALHASLERWPWLLMTFFATVAIAWEADDYDSAGVEPWWLRWAEAVALAVTFGACQWAIVYLLATTVSSADAVKGYLVAMPRMVATATVIGGLIGFLVPSLYRSKRLTAKPPAVRPTALATS